MSSEAAPPPRPRRGLYALVVVLVAWAGLMLVTRTPARPPVTCGEDLEPDADTVVMLSAAWCTYCRRARNYLQDNGIRHCEFDVETSAEGRERFAALPVKVIPVLHIRDDMLVGFNRVEIQQSLMAHGLAEFP